MYHCTFCKSIYHGYMSFLKHSSVHEHLGNFMLSCRFQNCPRQYTSLRALRVHLRKVHKFYSRTHQEPDDREPTAAAGTSDDVDRTIEQSSDLFEAVGGQDSDDDESVNFDQQLKCKIGKMLLGLREHHHLTSKSVSIFAEKMAEVVEINNSVIKKKVKEYLEQTEIDAQDRNAILMMINEDSKVVQDLNTLNSQKKLERFATRELVVVSPTEYVLGYDENRKPETFQYVSLTETMKFLLTCQDIINSVVNGNKETESHVLQDVTDGMHFQQHPLAPNVNTVSLILYVDEFTLTNPLRPQAKSYKIMATYFQIANLPAHMRSKLDSIHLISLCKTKHVTKYSLGTVFEQLVGELNSLATDGVTVHEVNFKCVLLTCVSDNLAAHQLGGFFESFSANHSCRFCTVSKADMQAGGVGSLRSPTDHDAQVARVVQEPNLSKVYGIKGPSVLCEVPHFHCVSGFPSDIGHDLFEGTLKDVLSRMLKEFDGNYFTIDEFNCILNEFPFMGTDKADKPCPIYRDGSVKQTICKMWLLFRTLPLLIGDKVPEGDQTWQMYLQLRGIVEYLTARKLKRGHIEVVRDLIQDYMDVRLEIWPDVPLKPKDHYMKHYADQIVKFGPLVHLWTLRFENKHQQFLQILKPIRCCKNVCKTMATRHQFQSALVYDKDKSHVDTVSIVNMKAMKLRDVPQHLRNVLFETVQDLDQQVVMGSGLMINKVLHSRGTVIITSVTEDGLQFAEVRHAFFSNRRYYIICQNLQVEYFSVHYHAYIVTRVNNLTLFEKDQLPDEQLLALYHLPNTPQLAVTLKSKVF